MADIHVDLGKSFKSYISLSLSMFLVIILPFCILVIPLHYCFQTSYHFYLHAIHCIMIVIITIECILYGFCILHHTTRYYRSNTNNGDILYRAVIDGKERTALPK
jgi:hypothetical protein